METMTETTYILVHGAWGGEWCWRDVGHELTRRDVQWTAAGVEGAWRLVNRVWAEFDAEPGRSAEFNPRRAPQHLSRRRRA